MPRALLALAIALCATPAEAKAITGPAKVIDTGVIEIDGQRIMLYGVDSVMRKQSCTLDGKPWQCWAAAIRELETLVDQGPTTCEVVGEPDDYNRVLGRCTINGESLNQQYVRSGFAVARPKETTQYVADEAEAKAKKVGLWQGQFVMPGDFRTRAGIIVDRP